MSRSSSQRRRNGAAWQGDSVKVANAIAEILRREGVEFIVAYPVNPIIEAAAEIDIRTIIVRQERVGLHMADAFSRLNSGDRIGVFCMQHGPGAENAFGGVAQAYSESVPLLVIPGGYPQHLTHVDPQFNSVLNFRHVTKSCEQLPSGRSVPDVMRRAFARLRNGRPRPVLIEVPENVWADDVADDFSYTPVVSTRSGPDPVDVIAAAEVLAAAERPVIYAGQGVHYAKAWPELLRLAERLNAPVTTSLEGKSAFPEDHPLSLGSGGRSLPAPVRQFVDEADVIFGIGCSFGRTAYGIAMPKGKTVIHATLDASDIDKDLEAQHALVGDAQLTLEAMLTALDDQPTEQADARAESVPSEIASQKQAWLDQWMPKLTSEDTPISPYRVIWELAHTVDIDETVITHDAGSPRDQLSPFWPSRKPLTYIGWGKTTQLGYGLGLAMGAKLARPDALCMNVWGDAAIGFTGMDFETAVRERIPILSILFNNFSMAIELPIMQAAQEKFRSCDISGDYAAMARAFGGYGERISEPSEIVPAIKRGMDVTTSGTPALLEFLTAKENEYSIYR